MKIYGAELAEGSEITNMTVATGTAFPGNANKGEMFFRTDTDILYVYNGTSWTSELTTPWIATGNDVYFTGGNVGISTSTPQSILDVQGGGSTSLIIGTGQNTASETTTLEFRGRYGGGGFTNGQILASIEMFRDATGNGRGDLIFKTAYDVDATERMRIDRNGNVGIGYATPAETLDAGWNSAGFAGIKHYTGSGITTGAGTGNGFVIDVNNEHGTTLNTNYTYTVRLSTYGTGTVTGATYVVYYTSVWNIRAVSLGGTTSNHPLLSLSGSNLTAYTNHASAYNIRYNVEGLSVQNIPSSPDTLGADNHWQRSINDLYYTDGNVGIGNSSLENWNSSYTVMQLGANASLWSQTAAGGSNQLRLFQNSYHNGSNYIYQDTGNAASYAINNGTHSFQVAASGTADTAIAWNTAMTIANTGLATFSNHVDVADAFSLRWGDGGERIQGSNAGSYVRIYANGLEKARFDNTTTAGNTGMYLWDVDSGTLQRVSVGADDSGGTGYKVLRIPN